MAIVGSMMMFTPIISLVITARAILRSLNKLLEGASEESVKAAIAQDIHNALVVTSICLGIALIGLMLVLVAFFSSRYRRPWMWWALLIAPIFPLSWWYIWIPWLGIVLFNKKKFSVKPAPEKV